MCRHNTFFFQKKKKIAELFQNGRFIETIKMGKNLKNKKREKKMTENHETVMGGDDGEIRKSACLVRKRKWRERKEQLVGRKKSARLSDGSSDFNFDLLLLKKALFRIQFFTQLIIAIEGNTDA